LKPSFYQFLDIAIKAPIVACGDKKMLSKLDDSNYDELFDDFLDVVFDCDGVLPRTNFEKAVRTKYPQIFDPAALRKKATTIKNVVDSDEDSDPNQDFEKLFAKKKMADNSAKVAMNKSAVTPRVCYKKIGFEAHDMTF
jgi:hypothetical protein